MPGWVPFVDWMAFHHLDGGGDLETAFRIAYKITDDGGEMWSNRFNRFKAKHMDAFSGGLKMMRTGIPSLLTALHIDPAKAVFVPALASGEGLLNDAFAPLTGDDPVTAVRELFTQKAFLLESIRERAPTKLLFRQPSILLAYVAVSKRSGDAQEAWPLTRAELKPIFTDRGLAAPDS